MKPILILTVGTGTAGRHSNLAAGLRRTLELLAPEKFWLVPSTDEVSQLTADLVREGVQGFQPWSEDTAYRAIARPDSLEECRSAVREVIQTVRKSIPRGGRLIVNPTSGTKQMSVGAALAALDEGVGELVFTVGERADGVVKTGTETLETFDASSYFAERDLATAGSLAKAGALAAAAAILRRHDSLLPQTETAQCLHEWERQNYTEARRIAAQSQAAALFPARAPLESLAKAAKAAEPRKEIIADMLHTADMLHRRRDFESALVLACRALEMGLRLALFEKTGLHEPYNLSKLCALPISQGIKDRCRQISNDGQLTILNLQTVAKILTELDHDLGGAFLNDRELQGLIRVRNNLMHQLRAVTEAESQGAVQRVKNLLVSSKLPDAALRPAL
ncbi:MAG: hypothetical protein JNM65_01585 [Verrucomicrobiaceae bacterium]|nr:hypothetical protein [Verrucomicrobiaceae bacterium]